MVADLDRDKRDALVSKRHKRREAMKRRARMKLRRKGDGYTHNHWFAGLAFSAVFIALLVVIIQVMGRWASS